MLASARIRTSGNATEVLTGRSTRLDTISILLEVQLATSGSTDCRVALTILQSDRGTGPIVITRLTSLIGIEDRSTTTSTFVTSNLITAREGINVREAGFKLGGGESASTSDPILVTAGRSADRIITHGILR